MTFPSRCSCGALRVKVIYAGLPGILCLDRECHILTGPAYWAARVFFNGNLMAYEGSYWRALLRWVTGDV